MKPNNNNASQQTAVELKAVAITSGYVILANQDDQVVGLLQKNDDVEFVTGPVKATPTDKEIPIIVATPGSYHAKLFLRPCFFDKPEGIWWGECRQTKEVVALKSNRTYHLECVSVACNALHYAHLPLYEKA